MSEKYLWQTLLTKETSHTSVCCLSSSVRYCRLYDEETVHEEDTVY